MNNKIYGWMVIVDGDEQTPPDADVPNRIFFNSKKAAEKFAAVFKVGTSKIVELVGKNEP